MKSHGNYFSLQSNLKVKPFILHSLNIQTIQVLEVMVLKFWISKYYALKVYFKYLVSRYLNFKPAWFWKRIIFEIKWYHIVLGLNWYRIHSFEMENFILVLKYKLFLNDRGVIITIGWQRDRDRIWTYSLSIPKTTLTNRVRGGDSRMK